MAAQLSEIGTNSLPITTTQASSPSHHQIQLQELSTPLSQEPRASTYQLREESAIAEEPETAPEPRPLARATSESSRPASIRSVRSKVCTLQNIALQAQTSLTKQERLHDYEKAITWVSRQTRRDHTERIASNSLVLVVQQEQPDVNLFIGTTANEPKASRKVPAYTPLRIRQEYLITMSSDNVTVFGSEAASLAGTTIAPTIRRAATIPPIPNKTGMVYPATAGSLGQQIREAGQHEQVTCFSGGWRAVKKALTCCCYCLTE